MSGANLSKTWIFKKVYKLHVYIGLFIAIHLLIFSLSGFILLFKDEIQNEPDSLNNKQTPSALEYQKIWTTLQLEYPQHRLLALFPDEENPHVIHVRLGIDGSTKLRGAKKLRFDANTSQEIINDENKFTGFFDWLLILHRELFLGSNGKLYVGALGLAYVFILISGFFLYGRFMKGRNLGDIRRGLVPSLVDTHKFLGIVTFGWSLIVAMTGVFLAFNGVLIKLYQRQSLIELTHQYQNYQSSEKTLASFDQVASNVLQAKSDSVISYISFPNTEFGIPGHYLFLVTGKEGFSQKMSELVVANAFSGEVTQILNLPLYLKLVLLSEPLHFGNYGGLTLKIVWGFLTLCSMVVVILGVLSFIYKRRKVKTRAKTPLTTSIQTDKWINPFNLAIISIVVIVSSYFLPPTVASFVALLLLIPISLILRRRSENV